MTRERSKGKKKIKVVLAGPYPKPGGMKGTYGRILDGILDSKIFQEEVEFLPLKLTLPADGNYLKRFCVDIYRFIAVMKYKPDIMHYILQKGNSVFREFPILKAAGLLRTATVVDNRGGGLQYYMTKWGKFVRRPMLRAILKAASFILVECPKDVSFVREKITDNCKRIPNSFPSSQFKRIHPANIDNFKEHNLRLIFSGRYSEKKGLLALMEALPLLSGKGFSVELHLTGQGDENIVNKMIVELVESPPPGIKVIDHGWDVDDLYGLLASCHIFIMPTTWYGEGHPNAVNEAMAAGLAMILGDWTHREDIVPEGGNIVVSPDDPQAIANAIITYAENPDILNKARHVNREWVKRYYLDSVVHPEILQVYHKLLSQP